jgi:hypothetical protein
MATESKFNAELGKTVDGLQSQFDRAVERTAELRGSGASEEVVLTQTAVAVRAAKALEVLTGVSWDSRLLDKAAGSGMEAAVAEAHIIEVAPAQTRTGWLRRRSA